MGGGVTLDGKCLKLFSIILDPRPYIYHLITLLHFLLLSRNDVSGTLFRILECTNDV